MQRVRATRLNLPITYTIATGCLASILVAALTAQQQHRIKVGTYVKLHGLQKAEYNTQESRVVKKEGDKAEVDIATLGKRTRTHCKNLSWMPTFRTSRCKLKPPQVTHFTFYPAKVVDLPDLQGTYYDYLGLNPKSTQEEIKSAYKTLSVNYHPNKYPQQ